MLNELGTDEELSYQPSMSVQKKKPFSLPGVDWWTDKIYLQKLNGICGGSPAYRSHIEMVNSL